MCMVGLLGLSLCVTGGDVDEEEQADAKRIAVLPFDGKPRDLQATISRLFTDALATSEQVSLVEQEGLDAVIAQLREQNKDIYDPETAGELGRLVGANRVVLGGFSQHRGKLNLSVRLVDVETGGIVRGMAASVEGELGALYNLVYQLADRFHRRLTDTGLPPQELAVLSGKVTDATRGEPVAEAEVKVGDATETTDEVGNFRLPELPPGERKVTVSADRFTSRGIAVTLEPGVDNVLKVGLLPSRYEESTNVLVSSEPPGAVVFCDGKQVTWRTKGGLVPATTPCARIGLEPGDHTVLVRLAGYVPVQQELELKTGRTRVVDVTIRRAGKHKGGGEAVLSVLGAGAAVALAAGAGGHGGQPTPEPGPRYSISGNVYDSSGGGLPGVRVAAGDSSAQTSSTGAYVITGLSVGTYTVTPSLTGHEFSPESRRVTVSTTVGDATRKDFEGYAAGEAFIKHKCSLRHHDMQYVEKSSPVLDSRGYVYVGCCRDATLYCLPPDLSQNPADGFWEVEFQSADRLWTIPTVGPGDIVYIGYKSTLYAFDGLTGIEQDHVSLGGRNIHTCPAIGADGLLRVATNSGKLHIVGTDPLTEAAPAYEYASMQAEEYAHSSAVISQDGTCFLGSPTGDLQAVTPQGSSAWDVPFRSSGYVYGAPAIGSDGTVYFGSFDHNLYAINPDGTEKWRQQWGSRLKSSPAVGRDGTVYVGTWQEQAGDGQGGLIAVNPDGTLKWHFQTDGPVITSPVVLSNGAIVFGRCGSGDTARTLFAVNDDGGTWSPRWQVTLDNTVYADPVVGPNGLIYVWDSGGTMYAIREVGAHLALADSPWPMFMHDPQHTGQSPYGGVSGASTPATVTAIQVTSLASSPTNAGGAQVTFTLSADAAVSAAVLNIAGRPVRTVVSDRQFEAGTNTLMWDGKSSRGLPVPSGVYLVRLRVHDPSGAQSQAITKLAIVR